MSESTAAVLRGLKDKLPRRTPKQPGSILGRPDPTADLAEHRLDDTKLMPAVEDDAEDSAPVTVADRLPEVEQPETPESSPQTLNSEYAADMRKAAQIQRTNGGSVNGYFDAKQNEDGTPVEQCGVDLLGALSCATAGTPVYVPRKIEGHLIRIAAYLGQPHFTAMWTWVEDHGFDEQNAALDGCADMLDPPATVEPQDDGELEAPAPEVPADADPCDVETVVES